MQQRSRARSMGLRLAMACIAVLAVNALPISPLTPTALVQLVADSGLGPGAALAQTAPRPPQGSQAKADTGGGDTSADEDGEDTSGILIFRPLDANARIVNPRDLLTVPGGSTFLFDVERRKVGGGVIYPFEVTISSLTPLRSVTINGKPYPARGSTSAVFKTLLLLNPGTTKVVVTATTATGQAEESFSIALDSIPMPGFPLYVPPPAK